MPRVIGLTGGVASGKSEVARCFEARGVPVLDADIVTRALVEPGQAALAEIAERFGPAALTPDGRLDRAWMRELVFEHPERRRELEAILHPRVAAELEACTRANSARLVVVAVPLLVEVGRYPWIDEIVVVDAPQAQQLARLRERDRIPEALALRIIQAQATRAQRLALADHVLCNAGSLDELRRATTVLHGILGLPPGSRRLPGTRQDQLSR